MIADPKEVIRNQLGSNIAGITEFLSELKEYPMTLKEAHQFFLDTLSVEWETNYQSKLRLIWLEATGSIQRKGGKYHSN